MAFLKSIVKLYKRSNDSTWSSTGIIVTDAYNIQITEGVGDVKDAFSFQVVNAHNKYYASSKYFEIGDQIKLYLLRNGSVANDATNLAMDGIITEPPEKRDDSGRIVTIKGKSRIESVFDALVFVDKTNATSPEVAEYVIGLVNNNNPNLQITWASTNPTLRSDNSAHDTHQFTETYKQAYLILEKAASDVYTKDGNYIFYLDTSNKFHFTYRSGSSSGTITEGVQPTSYSVQYDEQILNYLIINVGRGPDLRGNTILYMDPGSYARYGSKQKYITETNNLSEDLMQAEIDNDPTKFNPAVDGWYPTSSALSAGYTTHWKSTRTDSASPACTSGNQITGVSSKTQYNNAVRREAEWRGQDVGKMIIDKSAYPLFKVDVEVPRTLAYAGASLYTINIPSYNVSNKNLRLTQLTHTFWTTQLSLEEDEPTQVGG